MLVTQVVEKLIQRPSETLEAAKTKKGLQAEYPKEASSQKQNSNFQQN